jgi:hypothetical protein
MPDFGIMRGFNEKLFGDKLVAGQLPTQLGLIGSQEVIDYDADAQSFFSRVETAGGSLTTTEQTATNQLVLNMKSAGIWSAMKAVYPMVGASAAACSQNLKSSSFTGTFTSGWTFASTGVKGNGTSAYFNTLLNGNSILDGTNSHLSFYSRTLYNQTGDRYPIGAYESSIDAFYAFDTIQDTYLTALGSISQSTNASYTNSQGFIGVKKEANTNQKPFRNSTILTTRTQTSTNKPNLNFYLGALNIDGNTVYGYTNYEFAFCSIGDGLTDQNISDFYTAVQTFQTTLSRQV